MARGGSRKHRAQQGGRRSRPVVTGQMRREDTLVTEIWAYDRALGVRNRILARLRDHLTPVDRAELSEFRRVPWDIDQANIDLDRYRFPA